jgi:internalin A
VKAKDAKSVSSGAGQAVAGNSGLRRHFVDPFDDRVLLKYYHEIFKWHGYIRFLGMPHLRDTPDVPIDRLYVEPMVSEQHIPPDRRVDEWPECFRVRETLGAYPAVMLLGDPGSGKSTLVSWLAWQFTRTDENAWTRDFGRLIPLPMVVRDLSIGRDITWQGLLDAFLAHPMAQPLGGREQVEEILQRGQGLVLLDGLDEIGSVEVRRKLREAILEGNAAHPGARWLLTSRIVGYDEVPFAVERMHPGKPESTVEDAVDSLLVEDVAGPDAIEKAIDRVVVGPPGVRVNWAHECYLAPFNDEQIRQFSRNWYLQHEAAESEQKRKSREFVSAVRGHEDTLRLARVPNLLTLMALVYRVEARLPHGRALLYGRIATAYLESIDTFRGIQEMDYPPEQKERWLARVGYGAQKRRGRPGDGDQREVLLSSADVEGWILEAMAADGIDDEDEAREFIRYIGRRSGLLLPRGPDEFAFVHLSFQEYFAARYLAYRVTSPTWLLAAKDIGEYEANAPTLEDVRTCADSPVWQETLILLFELLAAHPPWPDAMVDLIYGDGLRRLTEEQPSESGGDEMPMARLLAETSVDPHSGLSATKREQAWRACWEAEIRRQQSRDMLHLLFIDDAPAVVGALLSAEPGYVAVSQEIMRDVALRTEPSQIVMTGARDLAMLRGLTALETLGLKSLTARLDLSPLSGLAGLRFLSLSGCAGVVDLSPLSGLAGLQSLYVSNCAGVVDLSPLSGLAGLQRLSLRGCAGLEDLSPLSGLGILQELLLRSCARVEDLSPLSGLAGLQSLSLSGCVGVEDLLPLSGLAGLQRLDLSGCVGVVDLSPLVDLPGLREKGVFTYLK